MGIADVEEDEVGRLSSSTVAVAEVAAENVVHAGCDEGGEGTGAGVGEVKVIEGEVKEASKARSLAFIPGEETVERAVVSVQGMELEEAFDAVSSSSCRSLFAAKSSRKSMAAMSWDSSSCAACAISGELGETSGDDETCTRGEVEARSPSGILCE